MKKDYNLLGKEKLVVNKHFTTTEVPKDFGYWDLKYGTLFQKETEQLHHENYLSLSVFKLEKYIILSNLVSLNKVVPFKLCLNSKFQNTL